MDRAIYDAMAEDEDRHWWFTGRRRVLGGLIARVAQPVPGGRVLDAGCGSGGNLAMLAGFGAVTGVELDDDSRAAAAARGIGEIRAGHLPDGFDVPDGAFALIGLFDVLEHLEQDVASLDTLRQKLIPGGKLVISVPAHPWLWSGHDLAHHHFRRYTRAGLRGAIESAGLDLRGLGYFNALLFPAVLLQRLVQKTTGLGASAARTPPEPLNALLGGTFAAERHLVGRLPLPPGLSLWAVAERRT